MEEKKKNILKDWKLWVGVGIIAVAIISVATIFILSNKMTPEETVSKFMYLIENKEYEKAKSLCSIKMEKLDVLSNIKPSNLTFDFAEDKKSANTVLLEDKETAEMTMLYVNLENSIFGWKIKEYTVSTDLIPQSVLQKRLENGQNISQSEFLLWAIYEETNPEDISKYADDNLKILTLFADFMKKEEYEKALKLYQPANSEVYQGKELSESEIKEFDWNNYHIYNDTELLGMNTYNINSYNEEINVMINSDHKIIHIYKRNK